VIEDYSEVRAELEEALQSLANVGEALAERVLASPQPPDPLAVGLAHNYLDAKRAYERRLKAHLIAVRG
jgi:hypothetical protein